MHHVTALTLLAAQAKGAAAKVEMWEIAPATTGATGATNAPTTNIPAAQPTAVAVPTPTTAPSQSTGVCDIKGNISNKGEKIYHVRGMRNYDDTVITESKGERYFCSEEEAVAAGWRRAKR